MSIDTLGIVGAGAMGSGIIEVAAKSGVSVVARDISPEAVEAGLQLAGRALEEFGYDGDSVRTRLALERDSEYMKATDG